MTDGLPTEVYAAVWGTDACCLVTGASKQWTRCLAALELLAEVEVTYPGHASVAHKRVNRLTDALGLARKHAKVTARSGAAFSVKQLAVACIVAMPESVNFDTPYGSSCTTAWKDGHLAFAATSPTFQAGLPAFEHAAEAERIAPRKPSNGRLKSMKLQQALVEAGKRAPWYPSVVALAPNLHRILRAP